MCVEDARDGEGLGQRAMSWSTPLYTKYYFDKYSKPTQITPALIRLASGQARVLPQATAFLLGNNRVYLLFTWCIGTRHRPRRVSPSLSCTLHLPPPRPRRAAPLSSTLATMPIEATMIIVDNSEFMRNGDYQPSRFGAQADAANTVFQSKVDSNPENSVGLMTMAGKGYVHRARCDPPTVCAYCSSPAQRSS